MQNKFFKKLHSNFLIFFIFILLVISIDKRSSFALDSVIDKNILSPCSNPNNCVLETWQVGNANQSFIELSDILKNTPRVEIINIQENYIHALAKSRMMKFIDDIEKGRVYQG